MIVNVGLQDGTGIPQLGFGTYLVPPEDTAQVVGEALEVGYRHLDTAQMYGNEEGVGEAVRASGIPREELYVTSKLGNGAHEPDEVRRSFDETLRKMGLDRLDLFLIHWPLPTRYGGDYVSTWKAVTGLMADGRLTSAGVSNFAPAHLDRIVRETGVAPVVNQIEAHPYFRNDEARAATTRHGAMVEAWSPLGQGAILKDPVVARIAEAKGRAAAQVVLRWHVQRGDIVFPKSTHRERMEENLRIFDFRLTSDETAAIDALDRGAEGRVGPDPDTFDWLG